MHACVERMPQVRAIISEFWVSSKLHAVANAQHARPIASQIVCHQRTIRQSSAVTGAASRSTSAPGSVAPTASTPTPAPSPALASVLFLAVVARLAPAEARTVLERAKRISQALTELMQRGRDDARAEQGKE